MSKYDYDTALGLIRQQGISYRALIMAALCKADRGQYKRLREKFPDIVHEYWDRHNGVRGFLRGENALADAEYTQRDANTEDLPLNSKSKRYYEE